MARNTTGLSQHPSLEMPKPAGIANSSRVIPVLAVSAALLASLILSVPFSWAVLLGALVFVMFVSLFVKEPERLLLAGLVLALPMNISKTLVYHPVHYGGAQALELQLLDLPLLALYALWMWDIMGRKARHVALPRLYSLSIAAFMLIGLISITRAVDPALTLFELYQTGRGVLILLYVAKRVNFKRDLDLILVSLLLSFSVLVGETLINRYLGTSFTLSTIGRGEANELTEMIGQGEFVRAAGSFGAPNLLASYVALLLPIAIGLVLSRTRVLVRVASLAAVVAGVVTLILTMSRGAWIALAVAVALMLAIAAYRRTISRTGVAAFAVTGVLAVALANFLMDGIIWLRFTSSEAVNVTQRYAFNSIAFKMISSNPLLGVGLNNFTERAHDYDPNGISYITSVPMPVHNIYLLVASELGIAGLLAFLVFIVAVAFDAVRTSALFPDKESWALLGVFGGIVTIMVQGLVDVALRMPTTSHTFWLFAGLVASAVIVTSNEGRAPTRSSTRLVASEPGAQRG